MLTPMTEQSGWENWQELIQDAHPDALEILTKASMYERYFQAVQRHAVEVLRSEGKSWQDIADAVDVTKQSAWRKWRTPEERAKAFSERLVEFPRWPTTSR